MNRRDMFQGLCLLPAVALGSKAPGIEITDKKLVVLTNCTITEPMTFTNCEFVNVRNCNFVGIKRSVVNLHPKDS